MRKVNMLIVGISVSLITALLSYEIVNAACPGSMRVRRPNQPPEQQGEEPSQRQEESKKESKAESKVEVPKKEEPSPLSGGGGEISPTASSVARPPLSVGLQPRLPTIRTMGGSPESAVSSLLGVVEPWEVWWTLNREKYLNFRQPIEWVTVKETEGTRTVIRHQIYNDLYNILVKSLEGKDYTLAWNAALALGRAGDTAAIPQLKKAFMESPHPLVVNYSLVALGWMKDASVVKVLSEAIADKNQAEIIRSHAAVALGYVNDPASIKALQEVISDKDFKKQSDVVSSALFSLGMIQDAASVKLLGGILNSQTRIDSKIRAYAALGLGQIGNKDAFLELKKAVADKEKNVRMSVVIALGLVNEPKAKDELISLLKDKEEGIRGMAAISLAQSAIKYPDKAHTSKAVADALLNSLVESKREGQGLIVIALGILGDQRAKPEFNKIMDNKKKSNLIKGSVIVAYGLLKDKEVVPLLIGMLNKCPDDPILAPYLILGLGMIGDERAADVIQSLWDKVDKNVSSVAYTNMAVALSMLGKRKEVVEQLTSHSAKGQNSTLRQYALHTLGLLADRDSAKVFVDAWNDENSAVRIYAVVGIGLLMEKSPTPMIAQWLANNNTEINTWIIDHLLPIPSW